MDLGMTSQHATPNKLRSFTRQEPYHIARRHNLRLDAAVRSRAVGAEEGDGVDGRVAPRLNKLGSADVGAAIRC